MLSGISLLLACGLTLNNAVSMPETATVSEPQSVYSENIYTPPATNPVPDERDSYENNDGFNVATPLSPENAHQLSSYHTQLTATIDTFSQIVDVDYYVLTLFTDSYVHLSVETDDESYSFTLVLMRLVSSLSGNTAVKDVENVHGDDSLDKSKSYQDQLKAGTYFVYIRGQQPSSSGVTLEYALDLTVSRSTSFSLISLGDLRFNKKLPGAIWLSDYVPFDLVSFGEVNNEYIFDRSNSNELHDPLLEKLTRESEGNPIHFATFYIWDSMLRYSLYETFDALYTFFCQTVKDQEIQNAEIEVVCDWLNNVSIVISVLQFGVKFIPLPKLTAALQLGLKIAKLAISFINTFLKSLIQKIDVTDSILYTSYFNFLKGLLYMDFENIGDNPDPNEIVNQDFDKVIQIPLYYSLRKENPNSETNSRSIISYKATLEKFESGDLFVCTSSSVSVAPDDCYSCYGKIYGFCDSADLDSINSLPEYSTIPDVDPNIKPLIFNEFNESDNYAVVSLFTGQYDWYQFTAPETRTYYFLCSGEEGMIAELFSQPVKGYSTQGLIRSYPKEYYFSKSLNADETIYLRVRHQNYQSCHGIIYFDDEPFSFAEPVPHEHHYVRYVWKNTRTHTSYCECGFSTSQGHAVSAGSSTCLFCGCRADIGFIGPSSVSSGYISENGSYLLPNGVIVLDEKDIDAYLSGELTFADNTRFAA